MERTPEYGVCRLIQSHVTDTLKGNNFVKGASGTENVHSQDEGDFETKMTASLSRNEGIALLISVETLSRTGPAAGWEVFLKVACVENVRMNRSDDGARYTALQVAEAVLAILHGTQMTTGPYAYLEAAPNAIELESETPVLIYVSRIRARLGPTLAF